VTRSDEEERATRGTGDREPAPIGLYVHVPFCSAICNYCNFNRGLLDEDLKRQYVDALVGEIAAGADGAPADTVYFGGGTPSLLAPGEVARVIGACRDGFALAADAEITLEANPDTVTETTLAGFRRAGVNRLSFGVQSFRDEELRRLGRLHDVARAVAAVGEARRAGFSNISLDLMMWLPGQRVDEWLHSVDRLVELAPAHASLYLLEIYPNAPLRDEMARGGWSVAPDDDAAEMYVRGLERLDAGGYEQYEISNVARPGRRSRHNMKYWADGEWAAFGCGAHGTRQGVRWRNVAGTADYVARVLAGHAVVAERRVMTPSEQASDALFMGLRLVDGVDIEALSARYAVDVWQRYGAELQPYCEAGILERDASRLRLTRTGMLLANEVMGIFV
jgi:oxygen-independent coproporphyrinogen III oxidase